MDSWVRLLEQAMALSHDDIENAAPPDVEAAAPLLRCWAGQVSGCPGHVVRGVNRLLQDELGRGNYHPVLYALFALTYEAQHNDSYAAMLLLIDAQRRLKENNMPAGLLAMTSLELAKLYNTHDRSRDWQALEEGRDATLAALLNGDLGTDPQVQLANIRSLGLDDEWPVDIMTPFVEELDEAGVDPG